MEYRKISFIYLLSVFLLIGCRNSEKKEMNNKSINSVSYELVKDWPKLPENFSLGNPIGLGVDTNGNIYVFHRAGRVNSPPPLPEYPPLMDKTILKVDRYSGELLNSWGDNLFIMPHGLTVDNENNIWVTDVGLHQIFKFDQEGKLLMTLGEAEVSGDDSTHFNLPTDIAVASDGSFYGVHSQSLED
jgi:peptidylamidoglycolate lyase